MRTPVRSGPARQRPPSPSPDSTDLEADDVGPRVRTRTDRPARRRRADSLPARPSLAPRGNMLLLTPLATRRSRRDYAPTRARLHSPKNGRAWYGRRQGRAARRRGSPSQPGDPAPRRPSPVERRGHRPSTARRPQRHEHDDRLERPTGRPAKRRSRSRPDPRPGGRAHRAPDRLTATVTRPPSPDRARGYRYRGSPANTIQHRSRTRNGRGDRHNVIGTIDRRGRPR